MTMTNKISIPFIELIKRSINYVFFNISHVMKLIAGPTIILGVLQIAGGKTILCNVNKHYCATDGITENSIMLISLLMFTYVAVCWCRLVVLNEESSLIRSTIKYSLRYILNYLLIGVFILVPSAIVFGILTLYYGTDVYQWMLLLMNGNDIPLAYQEQALRSGLVMMIVLCSSLILSSRLRVALAASAVDDQAFDIKMAWKMTQGNTWRLFGASLISSLPAFILLQLSMLLYVFFPQDNFIVDIFFITLFIALSLLDATLKASFDAHAYQFFSYFYRTKIEDGEALEVRVMMEERLKQRRKD